MSTSVCGLLDGLGPVVVRAGRARAAPGAVHGRARRAEGHGDAAARAPRRARDQRDPPLERCGHAATLRGVTSPGAHHQLGGGDHQEHGEAQAQRSLGGDVGDQGARDRGGHRHQADDRRVAQRTVPSRVWRQEPSMATGMIASSEVASACSWLRPRTSVSVGTKIVPPPTPNRPAIMPAAIPSAMISDRFDDHDSTM